MLRYFLVALHIGEYIPQAQFPLHGKCHDHDTKTSDYKAWFPLHVKCHDHDTKTKRL